MRADSIVVKYVDMYIISASLINQICRYTRYLLTTPMRVTIVNTVVTPGFSISLKSVLKTCDWSVVNFSVMFMVEIDSILISNPNPTLAGADFLSR